MSYGAIILFNTFVYDQIPEELLTYMVNIVAAASMTSDLFAQKWFLFGSELTDA